VLRDGDYFGRTVNVAARIADYARPGELLISDATAAAIGDADRARLRPIGPVSLKGVSDPVDLHTVGDMAASPPAG
jgi:adenylate cyclase